jgi:hypothetical protein
VLAQPKYLRLLPAGFDAGEDGQNRTVMARTIKFRVAVSAPVGQGRPSHPGHRHRLSAIRTADRVAMRQDDRTIATGTHDELLADDASYRRLLASQVRGVD